MFDWIIPSVINIVYSLGYFGIALMMFLENLFPPIPSELIMPLAGFTAKEVAVAAAQAPGKLPQSVQPLNIEGVFLAGLIGSTLGGLVWYYPGKMLALKRQDSKAVFIGRLLPGVRTLISVGVRVLVTCRCHLSYFIQHWVAHCG